MKKFVLSLLLALIVFYSKAQGPYIESIQNESISALANTFRIKNDLMGNYAFKSVSDVLDIYIESFVSNEKDQVNANFITKNKSILSEYLESDYLRMYFDLPDSDEADFQLPFGIIRDSDRSIFYQNWLIYDKVLNNVRLNSNERLKHILDNAAIPFVDNFKALLKIPEITHFSIMYIYLAQDFTDEHPMPDAETLFILMPKADIVKFLNLEYTAEDLIRKSVTYGRTEANSLKRVNLN